LRQPPFMGSHFFVVGGGVVYKLAFLGEARAVAGTVPCMLGSVVFEGAAEVRATRNGGREKPHERLECVDGKLWVQNTARGGKDGGV